MSIYIYICILYGVMDLAFFPHLITHCGYLPISAHIYLFQSFQMSHSISSFGYAIIYIASPILKDTFCQVLSSPYYEAEINILTYLA